MSCLILVVCEKWKGYWWWCFSFQCGVIADPIFLSWQLLYWAILSVVAHGSKGFGRIAWRHVHRNLKISSEFQFSLALLA